MATRTVNHAAAIFADMSVDGPVIGTLVAIIDRAKNLPNRKAMGKQDPYCAARLAKEAKKTTTDKRGGQTPKWDQELRFTVHDSPDYHRLKISVFNDDKKTELIGETWAALDAVITPGGGQSDDWHTLSCKGKYSGEIRIELTYYDTRPKAEKPAVDKRREPARPDAASPAVGGPRESMPVKRRPLPSASPAKNANANTHTPEQRGLRGLRAGPRELGSPRHQQRGSPQQQQQQQPDPPARRPLPDASPLNAAAAAAAAAQSVDLSYAAPKPYEVQAANAVPAHVRDAAHGRALSQDNVQSPRHHPQSPSQPPPQSRPHPHEPVHAHSAPMVPTQHTFEQDQHHPHHQHQHQQPSYSHHSYSDPTYHVAPLRPSRSRDHSPGQPSPLEQHPSDNCPSLPLPFDEGASHRRRSAMQPMVEDEDDMPPPPPAHRRNASTLPHPSQQSPHSFHDESPAPLNMSRYREEPQQLSYSPPSSYSFEDHARQASQPSQPSQASSERRMTFPRGAAQQYSRPESRDAIAPSPLRQDTLALPSSLIAGHDPSRDMVAYQAPPPSYDAPPRLRQYSEPAEYRSAAQYDAPVHSQDLVHHQSLPPYDAPYYPHDPPEQPRRTSPVHDAPLVKPRATSPGVNPRYSPQPVDDRMSRGPVRSMPTRKSVSPRPPPMESPAERRLSGVAFDPDSFDVYNPRVSRSPVPGASDDEERPGSSMEYNDKGQIVTFSGRVVDASDHLPIDNWAPEPTPKGTVKEKPARARAQLNGTRDIEAARQREEKYHRDREARDRIRHAASQTFGEADASSNALVTTRHDFNDQYAQSGALVLASQSRSQHVLREHHNPNSYGSSSRHSQGAPRYSAAPPIPAKIPFGTGAPVQNEDMALSLELQSIDIGPGSGGRRPRTQPRKQYGY